MLLDWLTMRLASDVIPDQEALAAYREQRPHVCRYVPATGEVEYNVCTREANRSDSHGIVVHAGGMLEITGSPSRSLGLTDNVFGTLDIRQAARAHLAAAENVLGFALPRDYSLYRVTRVDVTCNYDLGGLPEVRQALAFLRQSEGGRYKLRAQSETVYWSPGSRNRAGKAYAKGPHLQYQLRKGQTNIEPDLAALCERVLRLELKLGSDWWRVQREQGRGWWTFRANEFLQEHETYFSELIGTTELKNGVAAMEDVRAKLEAVAPTPGQAAAAHRTWCVIQSVGHQQAKESMPRASWYRHTKLLKAAGLGWADLSAGRIVQLRKTPLILGQPLTGWDELRNAA